MLRPKAICIDGDGRAGGCSDGFIDGGGQGHCAGSESGAGAKRGRARPKSYSESAGCNSYGCTAVFSPVPAGTALNI